MCLCARIKGPPCSDLSVFCSAPSGSQFHARTQNLLQLLSSVILGKMMRISPPTVFVFF